MIKEKIKLLALDLDGTTLRSDSTLSDRVKRSLETAIQSGIEVVAASGRPYASMPESILSIDGLNYSITSNGAAVCDKDGKRIRSAVIDESDVLKILDITRDEDFIFEAFIGGRTYNDKRYTDDPVKYGCSAAYVDYVRASHGKIENMREFIYTHRRELDGVEYVCTDKRRREAVRDRIAQSTSELFITSSSENFVEISAKNATKAKGLEYVCELLKTPKENTAACGNADNDADMVLWAGLGAAVRNSSKLCLDAADIVVGANDDDGVAQLIDYILKHNQK